MHREQHPADFDEPTTAARGRAGFPPQPRTPHDDEATADQIGEAAGGISGAVTGAALGSIAGPIGTLVGGIAGAVGGWWAGREIAEMASELAHDDDAFFRQRYDASDDRATGRPYEEVQPAYHLGHLASRNPDYDGREFDEIEADLRRGWADDAKQPDDRWSTVRRYARDGWDRGREKS